MKLNLGCGSPVPEGWTNVDYALGARLVKVSLFRYVNRKLKIFHLDWNKRILIHDLRKTFPWKDASVDYVYSSHTLEHLSRDEGRHFLAECHRVLKRGGVIRIVVPDLYYIVSEYINGNISADYFIEKLGVLYGGTGSSIKDRLAPFFQFPHRCMYDAATLKSIFEDIGFEPELKQCFESEIPDIRNVELEKRTIGAVIIEGKKIQVSSLSG